MYNFNWILITFFIGYTRFCDADEISKGVFECFSNNSSCLIFWMGSVLSNNFLLFWLTVWHTGNWTVCELLLLLLLFEIDVFVLFVIDVWSE